MDAIFGLKCDDCVVLVADTSAQQNIMVINVGVDKIIEIDGDKIVAAAGPLADCKNFTDFLKANVHLNGMRSRRHMTVAATANFARTELALALREAPFQVNLLLAGMSPEGKPELYWIDWLASMVQLDKAAHGFCAPILNGILDRFWHHKIKKDELLEVVQRCINQIATRVAINAEEFTVKILSKDGIETRIMKPTITIPLASDTGLLHHRQQHALSH